MKNREPRKCPYSVSTKRLMFDELWSEIQDAPGEIFDLPEMKGWDDDVEIDDLSFTENFNTEFDF